MDNQDRRYVAVGCPKCRTNRMFVVPEGLHAGRLACPNPKCGAIVSEGDVDKSRIKVLTKYGLPKPPAGGQDPDGGGAKT